MSYITYNPRTGEPTVWKDPKDCLDEWARVQEMRKQPHSLAEGAHANKLPTYPNGLITGNNPLGKFGHRSARKKNFK